MAGLDLASALLCCAFLLLIAEFFIPSGGLIGLIALCLAGTASFLAFRVSLTAGAAFVAITVLGGIGAVFAGGYLLGKSPFAIHTQMRSEDGYRGTPDWSGLMGKPGRTLTVLRPSGFARIGNQRVQVVSQSDIIDPGVPVKVIEVRGNYIVVAPINNEERS